MQKESNNEEQDQRATLSLPLGEDKVNSQTSAFAVQSTLKNLQNNYQSMENAIVSQTEKQQREQTQRYESSIAQIQSLKRLLKSEVEARQNAEIRFREMVQERSEGILNTFTVEYLNKMQNLRETVKQFEKRRTELDKKRGDLHKQVDTRLRQEKEAILNKVSRERQTFENAYQKQLDDDVKELKYIGELEYNFENLSKEVMNERHNEFTQLQGQIEQNFRSDELNQKEEATRKILLKQVNVIKNHFKMEVNSREVADKEIEQALEMYSQIIEKQVSQQRQAIKK